MLFLVVFLLVVILIVYLVFDGMFLKIFKEKCGDGNLGELLLILLIWMCIVIVENEEWIWSIIGFEIKFFWLICEVVVMILVWEFIINRVGVLLIL